MPKHIRKKRIQKNQKAQQPMLPSRTQLQESHPRQIPTTIPSLPTKRHSQPLRSQQSQRSQQSMLLLRTSRTRTHRITTVSTSSQRQKGPSRRHTNQLNHQHSKFPLTRNQTQQTLLPPSQPRPSTHQQNTRHLLSHHRHTQSSSTS